MQRIRNPYPDSTEKLMLAEQHGITLAQVAYQGKKEKEKHWSENWKFHNIRKDSAFRFP